MIDRSVLILLLLWSCTLVHGQDHITPGQFSFHVDSSLVYGTSTDYLGNNVDLALDLYKPVGNTDDERPLLVLVHGGAWLAGCKNDVNSGVVALAREFAERGYVVACVNYRLGWHKAAYVPTPAGPPVWPQPYLGFYAADTLEMVRALYRAQQDVKGAIRWLKARSAQDSTCAEKVFVGGESAGGFNAMAVGFLDRPEEKPASCGTIADAPVPGSNLLNQTGYGCEVQTWTVTEAMLQRPDLGPVDGTLNLNGMDARVQGVVDLFGGVPTDAFALDWWQGVDTPAVYLYHQSCDGVVPFNTGRPFRTLSTYCNLGATPWHPTYPIIHGSNAIANAFQGMADPPNYITDFTNCPSFNGDLALFECLRYGDNGSYHYLADAPQRAANIAAFLEPLASDPSACLETGIVDPFSIEVLVFPQPAENRIQLRHPALRGSVWMQLIAMDGRIAEEATNMATYGTVVFNFSNGVPNGSYLMRYATGTDHGMVRVVVSR